MSQGCIKVVSKLCQSFPKVVSIFSQNFSKLFQVGLNVVHVIQYVWRNKTYHFYQLFNISLCAIFRADCAKWQAQSHHMSTDIKDSNAFMGSFQSDCTRNPSGSSHICSQMVNQEVHRISILYSDYEQHKDHSIPGHWNRNQTPGYHNYTFHQFHILYRHSLQLLGCQGMMGN